MENKTNTTNTNTKSWSANAKQKKFMDALADGKELTLAEISALVGEEIKSGSINTLVSKGLVTHGEDKEIVVTAKRKVKTYKLAKPVVTSEN